MYEQQNGIFCISSFGSFIVSCPWLHQVLLSLVVGTKQLITELLSCVRGVLSCN